MKKKTKHPQCNAKFVYAIMIGIDPGEMKFDGQGRWSKLKVTRSKHIILIEGKGFCR